MLKGALVVLVYPLKATVIGGLLRLGATDVRARMDEEVRMGQAKRMASVAGFGDFVAPEMSSECWEGAP